MFVSRTRTTASIGILAILSAATSACSNSVDMTDPISVSNGFAQAVLDEDWEAAKALCAPDYYTNCVGHDGDGRGGKGEAIPATAMLAEDTSVWTTEGYEAGEVEVHYAKKSEPDSEIMWVGVTLKDGKYYVSNL